MTTFWCWQQIRLQTPHQSTPTSQLYLFGSAVFVIESLIPTKPYYKVLIILLGCLHHSLFWLSVGIISFCANFNGVQRIGDFQLQWTVGFCRRSKLYRHGYLHPIHYPLWSYCPHRQQHHSAEIISRMRTFWAPRWWPLRTGSHAGVSFDWQSPAPILNNKL